MFNKVKINHLLAVFLVLLAAVLISSIGGNGKKNRSFLSELTDIDTSMVSSLSIYSLRGQEPLVLEKEGGNWIVRADGATYNADNNLAEQLVNTLAELTSTRLAAKDKDRWDSYEVTDSLGTRVQVNAGKKVAADLYIGKFSYSQPPQQAMQQYMGRQPQGTMTSYVRLAGEKEVYAVEGFLRMMFNRNAKEFRDRTVLKLNKNDISRIAVQQPGGNYNITRSGNAWMIDGIAADSASMASYLNGLSSLTSSAFLDAGDLATGTPTYSVTFEDPNGVRLGRADIFYRDSLDIAITTSINPGTVFDGTENDLYQKIVKSKDLLFAQ